MGRGFCSVTLFNGSDTLPVTFSFRRGIPEGRTSRISVVWYISGCPHARPRGFCWRLGLGVTGPLYLVGWGVRLLPYLLVFPGLRGINFHRIQLWFLVLRGGGRRCGYRWLSIYWPLPMVLLGGRAGSTFLP